jgi:3-oxoacyl-[acyl-carrier protein] reductase
MGSENAVKINAGRRALITGSTGGIGLAIARCLVEGGADVVLNYKENKTNADSVVDGFKAKGVRCIAIQADMSVAADCHRLAKEAIEFLGGLDFLIHNAGPFAMGSVAEISEKDWYYILNANLSAGFHLTQACIEELRKSDYPCIVYVGGVNTGVVAAHPRTPAYAAAKVGLAVLMRTVAVEEGPNGIRANMVCPGFIDTGNYSESFREKAAEETPLRRVGEPDDVAKPVCWLLTKEASFVTGAIIDAGGGLWV